MTKKSPDRFSRGFFYEFYQTFIRINLLLVD